MHMDQENDTLFGLHPTIYFMTSSPIEHFATRTDPSTDPSPSRIAFVLDGVWFP